MKVWPLRSLEGVRPQPEPEHVPRPETAIYMRMAEALEANPPPDDEELIGARAGYLAELAFLLGVALRSARRHAARPDFPTPVGRGPHGRRIWRRAEVEAWAREHLQPRTTAPEERLWRPMSGIHRKGLQDDETDEWLQANDPAYFDELYAWRRPRIQRNPSS